LKVEKGKTLRFTYPIHLLLLSTELHNSWNKCTPYIRVALSWVYTSGFWMRLLHCFAIFNNLPWFCSIKVSYKNCNAMQKMHAETGCVNAPLNCIMKYLDFWNQKMLEKQTLCSMFHFFLLCCMCFSVKTLIYIDMFKKNIFHVVQVNFVICVFLKRFCLFAILEWLFGNPFNVQLSLLFLYVIFYIQSYFL